MRRPSLGAGGDFVSRVFREMVPRSYEGWKQARSLDRTLIPCPITSSSDIDGR
jgi:hypothetical protein